MSTQYITRFDGDYRFLSNFYPYTPKEGLEEGRSAVKIEYEGLIYPSTEHAYQAAKTLDTEARVKIRDAAGAGLAKYLGRNVEIRDDWEEVKVKIMFDLLKEKFKDPILRQKLLDTGGAHLIEGNWWHDIFWGVCYCNKCMGVGKNKLGRSLMILRTMIREELI